MPRSVWEHLSDLPTDLYESARRIGLRGVIVAIVRIRILCVLATALVYVVAPVDFLPDTLGAVGLMDDLMVLVLVATVVASVLRQLAVDAGRPEGVAPGAGVNVD
jgi:hypothetical protein